MNSFSTCTGARPHNVTNSLSSFQSSPEDRSDTGNRKTGNRPKHRDSYDARRSTGWARETLRDATSPGETPGAGTANKLQDGRRKMLMAILRTEQREQNH
ncbi:hypothetical protein M758_8G082300 [Ceratodon purpureus]|nr:hypothetical protein M758_8G082300 [Ceratodon purpureus]